MDSLQYYDEHKTSEPSFDVRPANVKDQFLPGEQLYSS